ncbi:uncharacterized protein N7483_006632 [Penicillium malachiteum]|uniref:uncharacterized protein n=1 Tax=Penicillium malachiteum TaxID=1324776 RepID=UPI002547C5F1|nr:uncharacterized protein N7483_006632 [Penicillium malachiteum]KAJ5725275.1 hypothetical protein N7483_006632 [Penicillium malachiteum]
MPHLRRQPNPHDLQAQGPNAPGSLRAQFQTPPTRHTPSNPTHRHIPSSESHEITPEQLPPMAPPSGIPNPFSIFGRGRLAQPPPPPAELVDDMEEDEVFGDADDDYDPNARGIAQSEYDVGMMPEDDIDPDDEIEDTGDLEIEELDAELNRQFEADEEMHDREKSPSPLPPNVREISSLASWTVSTSKPGCGVAALRHPSPQQYWQSDGPQPHYLTLHFFKLVAIVRIRVYLDFELDESYTPTKMIFLAGMGGNDLVEFATWEGDGPCGWVDVPLEGVGGRNGGWVQENTHLRDRNAKNNRHKSQAHGYDHIQQGEGSDAESFDGVDPISDELDPYCGNVLKAMVVQMRIVENHQNGKDTHVRGFQVFSCDDNRAKNAAAPSASADARDRHRRHSARQSLRSSIHDPGQHARLASEDLDTSRLGAASGLDEPDWMGEPVIR